MFRNFDSLFSAWLSRWFFSGTAPCRRDVMDLVSNCCSLTTVVAINTCMLTSLVRGTRPSLAQRQVSGNAREPKIYCQPDLQPFEFIVQVNTDSFVCNVFSACITTAVHCSVCTCKIMYAWWPPTICTYSPSLVSRPSVHVASFPGPARSSLAVRNSRRGPGLVHHVMCAAIRVFTSHQIWPRRVAALVVPR